MSIQTKIIPPKDRWVEIDLSAIKNNVRAIQNVINKNVNLMPVVKAQGYGHGLVEVAKICSMENIRAFSVANTTEGIQLRKSGIKGLILVLYDVPFNHVKEVIKYNLSVSVYSEKLAISLNDEGRKQNKQAKIHIPLDTGMNWYGLDRKNIFHFIEKILKLKNLKFEGIYSHLSQVDKKDFTQNQLKLFQETVSRLENRGIFFQYKHIAKSEGFLFYKNSFLDFIRPGILIYGISPSYKKIGRASCRERV